MSLWAKPLLFLAAMVPLLLMVAALASNQLGPDPAQTLMHGTGEWAARLLIASLLVSPLRAIFGWNALLRLRRMLGLFAFAYASLHLLLFIGFYLGWSLGRVGEELLERPYITVGFLAWLIMLPLAATSNQAMQRWLKRNWQRLHRAVYMVAVLVSFHILWQARSDLGEALFYGLVFATLLIWRLIQFWKKQPFFRNFRLFDRS